MARTAVSSTLSVALQNINLVDETCKQALRTTALESCQQYTAQLKKEVDDLKSWLKYQEVDKAGELLCMAKSTKTSINSNRSGSLILFLLGISSVDPIKNKSNIIQTVLKKGDAPDIDVDFDIRFRQQVKDGMSTIFGVEHVCSVGSYQLMQTKSVIKDVGRVFCLPTSFLNGITKRLAEAYNDDDGDESGIDKIDWDTLVKRESLLQQLFQEYPYIEQHCKILRGQVRNIGKHPAGMIVASVNLYDWIPVRKEGDDLVACWTEGLDLKELQSLGLIKYDILGLRTVSVITDVVELVEQTTVLLKFTNGRTMRVNKDNLVDVLFDGKIYQTRVVDLSPGHVVVKLPTNVIINDDNTELVSYETTDVQHKTVELTVNSVDFSKFDVTTITMNDQSSFKRLNSLDVFGVFQFETDVAKKIINEIGIDSFNDIYAATTLGRPDPLSGKLHEIFGRRKHLEEHWESVPIVADILDSSYNLPIFQEQCMSLSQRLAGFSSAEANILRKGLAKGKDNPENMKKLKALLDDFKTRAQKTVDEGGITQQQLDNFVAIIRRFGGYGFNKCLSPLSTVTLKNGGIKTLNDVCIGDEIRCFDPTTKSFCYHKVLDKISSQNEMYHFLFSNNKSLICSFEHKVMCNDSVMRPMKDVVNKKLSVIYKNNETTGVNVTSFTKVNEMSAVDLEIDSKMHNFIADGFVVSNSHAVSYSMLAYWTLFLKTHYPTQFMCTLFNFTDRTKVDNRGMSMLSKYVRYCRQRSITVLPPDINESKGKFTLVSSNTIRWGLGTIKNIAVSSLSEILKNQPYLTFDDFCNKVEKRKVNKSKVVSLIKSGAFDCFGNREYLLNKYFGVIRKEKNYKDVSMSEEETLIAETDLLGVCLSQTIMPDLDNDWLKENKIKTLGELSTTNRGLFIGKVKDVKKKQSRKSGKDMLIVIMHDDTSEISFFVWEKDIDTCLPVLQKNKIATVPLRKFDDGGGAFYGGPKDYLVSFSDPRSA